MEGNREIQRKHKRQREVIEQRHRYSETQKGNQIERQTERLRSRAIERDKEGVRKRKIERQEEKGRHRTNFWERNVREGTE